MKIAFILTQIHHRNDKHIQNHGLLSFCVFFNGMYLKIKEISFKLSADVQI